MIRRTSPAVSRHSARRPVRPVALALLVLALVPLAGCLGATDPATDPAGLTAAQPIPAPSRLQVDRVRVSHVMRFAPGSANAAPGELGRLQAFLDAVQPRPVDRIALAATTPAAAARLAVLQRVLAARGITAGVTEPVAAGGDLAVLSVERAVVVPIGCLTDGGQMPPDGGVLPGFGCANSLNLARMVADPADLERGRPAGPADGAAAVLAIERYRAGQITPLVLETASGKVEQIQSQNSGTGQSSGGAAPPVSSGSSAPGMTGR